MYLYNKKAMKFTFHRIACWCLGFLGFAAFHACDEKADDNITKDPYEDDVPAPEYGAPYTRYRFKGKVVDEDHNGAVCGVKATLGLAVPYEDQGVRKTSFIEIDPGCGVDDDGGFLIEGSFIDIPNAILLSDPDPLADGHYKDTLHVLDPGLLEDMTMGAEDLELKMKNIGNGN